MASSSSSQGVKRAAASAADKPIHFTKREKVLPHRETYFLQHTIIVALADPVKVVRLEGESQLFFGVADISEEDKRKLRKHTLSMLAAFPSSSQDIFLDSEDGMILLAGSRETTQLYGNTGKRLNIEVDLPRISTCRLAVEFSGMTRKATNTALLVRVKQLKLVKKTRRNLTTECIFSCDEETKDDEENN